MSRISRRKMIMSGVGLLATVAQSSSSNASETVKLTRQKGDMSSFMEVFGKRQSTRAFSSKELEDERLAELLWAANGINRPASGGRTAPSWHGSYGSDVLIANARGVWAYDHKGEMLNQRSPADIRMKISPQPFVATAPTVILHLLDVARMYKAAKEEQIKFGYVDAAMVAQNIYLYCASVGLGTCLVGGVDAEAMKRELKLSGEQQIVYAQPIGYPKPA
jgi:nitroreductase